MSVKMIALIDIVAKVPESTKGIILKGTEFLASKDWAKKLEKIKNAEKAVKKEKKEVKPFAKKKVNLSFNDDKDEDGLSSK